MDDFLTPAEKEGYFEELAERGKDRVKYELEHERIHHEVDDLKREWISGLKADKRRRQKISTSEQIEIARRASEAAGRAAAAAERQATAAERTNTKATIALVITIVSAIGTLLPYWPHK